MKKLLISLLILCSIVSFGQSKKVINSEIIVQGKDSTYRLYNAYGCNQLIEEYKNGSPYRKEENDCWRENFYSSYVYKNIEVWDYFMDTVPRIIYDEFGDEYEDGVELKLKKVPDSYRLEFDSLPTYGIIFNYPYGGQQTIDYYYGEEHWGENNIFKKIKLKFEDEKEIDRQIFHAENIRVFKNEYDSTFILLEDEWGEAVIPHTYGMESFDIDLNFSNEPTIQIIQEYGKKDRLLKKTILLENKYPDLGEVDVFNFTNTHFTYKYSYHKKMKTESFYVGDELKREKVYEKNRLVKRVNFKTQRVKIEEIISYTINENGDPIEQFSNGNVVKTYSYKYFTPKEMENK